MVLRWLKFAVLLCALVFQPAQADDDTFRTLIGFAWHPQNSLTLRKQVNDHISQAETLFPVTADPQQVKAIIVPHAGFSYGGLALGSAYQTIINKKNIKRVVLLAPSHYEKFRGIAVPDFRQYDAVMGNIKIDTQAIEKLKENTLFIENRKAFRREHSIEIQLPFLQRTVDELNLVPLAISELEPSDYDAVVESLKTIIDANTLVVVSSDFMHYGRRYKFPRFDKNISHKIKTLDSLALSAIYNKSSSAFDQVIGYSEQVYRKKLPICGRNAIKILLKLIEENSFGQVEARLAAYYNSAQKSQVNKNDFDVNNLLNSIEDSLMQSSISYASVIFTTEKLTSLPFNKRLTGYERAALLQLAEDSIQNEFNKKHHPANVVADKLLLPSFSPGLQQEHGVFVTLRNSENELRACQGSVQSLANLSVSVAQIAKAAAQKDKRFDPITEEEFIDIHESITIIDKPKRIEHYYDIDIKKQGILMKKHTHAGMKSAVFLQPVIEYNSWNLPTALKELSLRAGLGSTAWKDKDTVFEVVDSYEF